MTHSLQQMRHTAAGILAVAVCDLFPAAQLVGGGAHEWGFYYDFVIEQPIDASFIAPIEETMRRLIKQELPILNLEMMRENAAQLFNHRRQKIKSRIVSQVSSNILPIFRLGDFYDYLPGEGVTSSSEVGAIKICELAPQMLFIPGMGDVQTVRIQGTAQENPQTLKKFLKQFEAAKRRAHTLLGPECQLFDRCADAGLSDWVWLPKGIYIKERLLELWRQWHPFSEYRYVETPKVLQPDFLKKIGYLSTPEKSRQLFPAFEHEGAAYILTPSEARANFHAWTYQLGKPTYRDLPLRFAECGEVFEKIPADQAVGMFRKSCYTADAVHSFCLPGQLSSELISSLHFILKIINMVAFEWRCCMVVPEQKRILRMQGMAQALSSLTEVLGSCRIAFEQETSAKDMSGPRIEFRIRDALGREWLGPSLEVNLDLPSRMQLRFVNANGIGEQPFMVARSLFGSLDAFISLIVEQCAGVLPLWLAPEQVRVIPIGNGQRAHAGQIAAKLREAGLRVSVADGESSLGVEVHSAECLRVPYMVIAGSKEANERLIAVRTSGKNGKNSRMSLEAFISLASEGLTKIKQE